MGKHVMTTKLPGAMKEFGGGRGLFMWINQMMFCGGRFGLIEGGMIEEYRHAARGFVELYNGDDIVDEFERVLEGVR